MAQTSAIRSAVPLRLGAVREAIVDRLERVLGKSTENATRRDIYDALSIAVREELTERWIATGQRVARARVKRICYLSMEFLLGRSLINALSSFEDELLTEVRETVESLGHDLDHIAAEEEDPGLGNGGLGRLAACFLDSLATLGYAATGYGIRYDYGIFTQVIEKDGAQREVASSWLGFHYFWETGQGGIRHRVRFGGQCRATRDDHGRVRYEWVDTQDVWAVGYDLLIPGNRSPTVNHLRLWSGRAITPFRIEAFNHGNYAAAVAEQVDAKNLTRVLYPDDSTPQGKELRFKQQYFFVSASLQDLLGQHMAERRPLKDLSNAIAVQLNDTHPALTVVELMRLLVDTYDMEWAAAWKITREVCSYTNHTLLPEALETWPVSFFERLLPRHLQIVYQINRDFLEEVSAKFPQDLDRRRRMSLINEDGDRRVRMAYLSVVGSHRVNGVAKLHSRLMRETIFSDFAQLWPERFTNVTNGIAVRRWLKQANPLLSALLTEKLGPAWENDLEDLERLKWAADDADFRHRFREIKRANKERLAKTIHQLLGVTVSVDAMFDVQVKRIHEYKRQLLNLLHVVARYQRLLDNPDDPMPKRVVMFAGKAAPGYHMAKAIIKLINNIAHVINNDARIGDKLKVCFLPDYDVTLAQEIMPAADLSEQISTAGMEASGTGNMKLSLNGALTIGTLDGANIEIKDAVGDENIFIFGMTTEEVVARRAQGYSPADEVARNPALKRAIELIDSGYFTPDNIFDSKVVSDRLLSHGEHFLVLADFDEYMAAQARVDELFLNTDEWTRKSVINALSMGPFSSDRSIREYADSIWAIKPVL
ncbi:alpha-1,4 glucan phosphorylase [Steroidobacter agaridevorans]|uniref:Alpha-1,4 glucan phosphorylase n=1 Tax=Steroidobacter agaridevorans TaxID=2695856 RepID=A0A829Y502_9GAMM|nr:glycogen/starch/alpha-glucan phosphorylase [Steroidobacter agaridevorans]GFE78173.1 alpha-1,4 glucan phosphorylase [Steroidobacter agaridevorans]GFE91232.1 alpha-1,4 glucan phosphorylase [Steroidobacter agaridevorans]